MSRDFRNVYASNNEQRMRGLEKAVRELQRELKRRDDENERHKKISTPLPAILVRRPSDVNAKRWNPQQNSTPSLPAVSARRVPVTSHFFPAIQKTPERSGRLTANTQIQKKRPSAIWEAPGGELVEFPAIPSGSDLTSAGSARSSRPATREDLRDHHTDEAATTAVKP